jgi:hypothetical protein
MRNSATAPPADLYDKLAAKQAMTDPRLTNRGTGTFSVETVDEDRATDRNVGLPLR